MDGGPNNNHSTNRQSGTAAVSGSPVQCYVYDISQGFGRILSQALLGQAVHIVPHTGIVVFGMEVFLGGGPCVAPIGASVPFPHCEVLDLGYTHKTEQELQDFLVTASREHSQENYRLLNHNCNHFASDVAVFLTGNPLPSRIVDVADHAFNSTPQGQQIRQMIEMFEEGLRTMSSQFGITPRGVGQGAGGFNPFGRMQSNVNPNPNNSNNNSYNNNSSNNYGGAQYPPPPQGDATNQQQPQYYNMFSGGIPLNPEATAAQNPPVNLAPFEQAKKELDEVEGDEQKRDCYSLLVKCGRNILEKPNEYRYRRIPMESPAFQRKVACCPGGTEIFIALGFEPETLDDGQDYWVYSGNINELRVFTAILESALREIPVEEID